MRMLSTSYLNVGAAAIYSIGLVPIVLHFTSVSELGLWTLVTQFTAYLSLVDAGVCSACVRRFVGPIARKEMPTLAGILKTAFLVSLYQGALCCLFGLLSYPIGLLLGIGPENLILFSSVLFVQFILVGIFFLVRPFSALLLAAQRFEVNNLVSSLSIVLSLGIIWVGFRSGLGLWALPLASLFQQIISTLATAFMVRKLHLLPHSWWRQSSTWKGASNLFLEALDFFSWSGFSVAGSSLQSIFLSRFLGLEAVAIWNVGSKLASFAYMLLSNLFNTAFMGLAELKETGDPQRCCASFLNLFISSISLLSFFAGFAILLNPLFILIWTHNQVTLPPSCTGVIFCWLILASILRGLACFSNVWQTRNVMRMGPALEFFALLLFLIVSLVGPSLLYFSLALLASQIPPFLLAYAPLFLAASKSVNVQLSRNQCNLVIASAICFGGSILIHILSIRLSVALVILLIASLPWFYFFSKSARAFMGLHRS
jgi:O-antigen/teichoic acid export membrane protein